MPAGPYNFISCKSLFHEAELVLHDGDTEARAGHRSVDQKIWKDGHELTPDDNALQAVCRRHELRVPNNPVGDRRRPAATGSRDRE